MEGVGSVDLFQDKTLEWQAFQELTLPYQILSYRSFCKKLNEMVFKLSFCKLNIYWVFKVVLYLNFRITNCKLDVYLPGLEKME